MTGLEFQKSFVRAAGLESRFDPPEEGGVAWRTFAHVAGFRYHHGPEVLELLCADDLLDLRREPENPFDPKAVRIEWFGVHLGYVPRSRHSISGLMDRGIPIVARIRAVNREGETWEAVRVELCVEGRNLAFDASLVAP